MSQQFLFSAPLHLVFTGTALLLLFLVFVIGFGLPAWRQARLLKKVLQTLESKDLKDARDPQTLDKAFPKEGEVAHLWREYKKTLYAVPGEAIDGIAKVRWASTAPAEVVWNSQLAVDQRVGAEFFKHLPGIFTGLGIIGTFFGLIEGLRRFEVSSNADVVRGSLESLMHSEPPRVLRRLIMPTLSVDDLIAFHNATGCPLADARRVLMGVEPELQERILIAVRARKSKSLELKDPIEQDPVIRLKVRQAEREAEDQVSYQGLGRCHAVWDRQANILWDEHGIRWYSPAQMNLLMDYD